MTITEAILGYLTLSIICLALWSVIRHRSRAEEMADRDAEWRVWEARRERRAQKATGKQ